MVGSKKRLRFRILPRKILQRKLPGTGVYHAGSTEAAEVATLYHPVEQTHDHDCGDGISISPGGTRRKGKLVQILRKQNK